MEATKTRILIVDDSALTRMKVNKTLTEAGYEVIEAENKMRGMELFRTEKPGIVLLDLLMPDVEDEIEMVKEFVNMAGSIPIVVFSANIQKTVVEGVLAAGAAKFVEKSYDHSVLLSVLSAVLEKNRREPDVLQPPDQSRTIILSPMQKDALNEVMNVAMGRAANTLNKLVNTHVKLWVPEVHVLSASDLESLINKVTGGVGGAILTMYFTGPPTGRIGLFFPSESMRSLLSLLWNKPKEDDHLSVSDQTVLEEVANILLNSAISGIADLLKTRLKLSLPTVTLRDSENNFISWLTSGMEAKGSLLVVLTQLSVREYTIHGMIILTLAMEQLSAMLSVLQEE